MKTKFLFLLTLILLVGCEPVAEFVYVNVTQYHTTETVREVQVACPTCPSCPAQKACPTPVKCDDELSAKKLTICYAQMETVNDELFSCYQHNTSAFSTNQTYEFNRCIMERKDLQDTLNNITEILEVK